MTDFRWSLPLAIALSLLQGCGIMLHEVLKPDAEHARTEMHDVRVESSPSGATVFIQGDDGALQGKGTTPAVVSVPYEVRGGSSVAGYTGLVLGSLIDLGLTAGLASYTADREGSKVLPVLGLIVMGVVLIGDVGAAISEDNRPTISAKDVTFMARMEKYADAKEKLSVPGQSDVHLTLQDSALTVAERQLQKLNVVRRAYGKMLVLEVRAGRGLPADLTKIITSVSASELKRHNSEDVLGVADVDAMLEAERVKDAVGCTDTACFAEIGGQLGTKLVLAGDVEKAGSFLIFSYRLIDTQSSTVAARYSHREQVQGDLEDAVITSIPAAIAGLLGELK